MVNYSNGKIYKITCDDSLKCYIGSTSETLKVRFSKHNANYRAYLKNKYNYFTAVEVLSGENPRIELLEEIDAGSKEELNKRERFYIESIEYSINKVNKNIPTRTPKEYYNDNINSFKEYYINNKDKIKDYQKNKYEKLKDKLKKLEEFENKKE